MALVIAGLAAACTSGSGGDGRGDGAVVRTDAGAVRGTVHDRYRSFQAIPHAAPPVVELCWRSPQPVTPPGRERAMPPGPGLLRWTQFETGTTDVQSLAPRPHRTG